MREKILNRRKYQNNFREISDIFFILIYSAVSLIFNSAVLTTKASFNHIWSKTTTDVYLYHFEYLNLPWTDHNALRIQDGGAIVE